VSGGPGFGGRNPGFGGGRVSGGPSFGRANPGFAGGQNGGGRPGGGFVRPPQMHGGGLFPGLRQNNAPHGTERRHR
jgi:hypothetical protein